MLGLLRIRLRSSSGVGSRGSGLRVQGSGLGFRVQGVKGFGSKGSGLFRTWSTCCEGAAWKRDYTIKQCASPNPPKATYPAPPTLDDKLHGTRVWRRGINSRP